MSRALALALALAVLAGCGQDPAGDPRGPGPNRGAPPAVGEQPTGDPTADNEKRVRLTDLRPEKRPPRLGAPVNAPQAEEAPPAPERDLASELRALIGDPSSCLPTDPELPALIQVQINATVSSSGVVTRSSAESGQLPDSALSCIRGRLNRARFQGPVPDAPRTVGTSLSLRREAKAPSGS